MNGLRKRIAVIMAVVLLLGYIPNNHVAAYGMQDILSKELFYNATTGDATTGDATSGNATPGDATSGNATPGDATSGNAYIYIYDVFKTEENANEQGFVEVRADDRSLNEILQEYMAGRENAAAYRFEGWYWYETDKIDDNQELGNQVLSQTFEQVTHKDEKVVREGNRVVLKVCPGYKIDADKVCKKDSSEPDYTDQNNIGWYKEKLEIRVKQGFELKTDTTDTTTRDKLDSKNHVYCFDETKEYKLHLEDNNPYTFDSEKLVFGVDSEGPCIEKKETYSNSNSYNEWIRGERVYVWKLTDIGSGISDSDIEIKTKSGMKYDFHPEFQLISYEKEQNKYEYELKCSISENDEYTIEIKDRAGNDGASAVFQECKISKENPSIRAQYKDSVNSVIATSGTAVIDYVNIDEDIEVTVRPAADSQAEINKIEYEINDLKQTLGELDRDDQGNVRFTIDKAEISEGQNTIQITAVDALMAPAKETYIIYKDVSTPSDASITPRSEIIETEEGERMYLVKSGDVIEIRARDEYSGFPEKEETAIHFLSGVPSNYIQEVEYELNDNGKECIYRITLKVDQTITKPVVITPIKYSISDKCGNSVNAEITEGIIFDGKAPEIKVSYEYVDKYGEKKVVNQNDIDKVLLSNQSITALVTIEDDYPDNTEAGYGIELVNDSTNERKKVEISEIIKESLRQTIRFDIDGEMSGKYHLKISAKDLAGNDTYYNTSQTGDSSYAIYLDKEEPELWSDNRGYEGNCTKNSVFFDIHVSDDSNNLLEGIESVWYTFTEDSEFEAPSIIDVENGNYTKVMNVTEKFELPVYNTESRKGFYHVWAYDASGNCGVLFPSLEVNIDVGLPAVSEVPFDTVPVLELENGVKAFNTDVDLRATVMDIDSKVEKTEYQIYDQGKGKYLLPDWEEIKAEGEDIRIHIDSRKYETDNAVVIIRAFDQADNVGMNQSGSFAIDVTRPQIGVTLTEKAGSYAKDANSTDEIFPAPRIATIVVREHNFAENGMEILVDGEREENITWEQEGDIHRASIHFGMEGLHTISISGKDVFFNGVDDSMVAYEGVQPRSFIVDTVEPKLTATYEYRDANDVQNNMELSEPVYTKDTVIVHFTVTDDWLDKDGKINVEVMRSDNSGVWKSYEASGLNTQTMAEGWCQEWNGAIVLSGIENESVCYRLRVKVYDEAGNSKEMELQPITIDKQNPSITGFGVTPSGWSSSGNISISGGRKDDTGFLVENNVYYRVDGSESFMAPTLAQLKADAGWYTGKIEGGQNDRDFTLTKISGDCNEYYHFWTYDIAGNPTPVQTGHIQIDTQAPDIFITAEDTGKVKNENYDVTIRVEDGYRNGVRSGLQSMSYVITAGGEVTQSGTKALEGAEQVITITVDAKLNEGKDIEISATVTDNAGNSNTYMTGSAGTDVTRPVITVSYDNNEFLNEKYFKQNRTAYITIIDHNFQADLVEMVTDGIVSEWSHEGDFHRATVTYDKDGDYEFHISCKDLAGNESEPVQYGESAVPEQFTIDKTLPLLWITYDNNDAENGNYYKASRVATIHIMEHNFDPVAALAGISLATGPWNSDGDEHWTTVAFTEEGQHELEAIYTDLAGNYAAEEIREDFVIDKTAPVITAADILNRKAYNTEEIMPVFRVEDANFDAARVEIELIGSNSGDVTREYLEVSNGEMVGTYRFRNILEDDLYTLQITAIDKAGNRSTTIAGADALDGTMSLEQIRFSVNRKGSVYTLDDYTRKLVGEIYVKSVEDVAFYETNVNILNTIRLTIAKDNRSGLLIDENDLAEITLVEGAGYTIERENVNGGWSQYKYVIHKSNFTEDGIYRLSIYSTDEAGNVSENTMESKLAEINFMVDSTEPICIVSDLKSGTTYNMAEKRVVFEPQDNLLLRKVEVYLNDVQVAAWEDAEQVSDFSFVIAQSNTEQSVRIVCIDAAGNIGEERIEKIYVTTDKWIRLWNNKKLLYSLIFGGVAAVLAAGGSVSLLVARRRKKG